MTEENKVQAMPHNLIMENRNHLTVSGVSDVDSFDEQTVVIFTQMGELTVHGSDLHITNLNVDSGELSLDGTISSLSYSDEQPRGGGFFSRVFK
ncbi:MAG: sporulation protein YabP [Acutalibacteraceae bacterium]